MPKFLFEGAYSTEAAKGITKEGGSSRRTAVDQLVKSAGGRLECFYFAFGTRDYVIVADLPDTLAAAAVSASVAATGATRVMTTPLLTPEEFDQAVKKTISYRPPGR